MSDAERKRLIVIGGLVLLAGVFLGILVSWAFSATRVDRFGAGTGAGAAADPAAAFVVRGDLVEVIAPGSTIPLNLTIASSHESVIVVTGLVVTVESVTAPRSTALLPCTTDDFVVSQASATLVARVPPGSSSSLAELELPASLWPTVGMINSDSNQDGCKGATLTLRYEGSAQVER